MTTDSATLNDSAALLRVFIGWFAGREDLYVKNAALVVREPLTDEVVRDAIAGHYAISAYLGREDGSTHVGAIDFDTDTGLSEARTVASRLWVEGVPTLLCHSRRGAHLWVGTWDYVPVATMRRALEGALALVGIAPDPKVEVFPKPGAGLAVGALRLPRLPHQKTGEVYPAEVLDEDGWSMVGPDLIDLLEAHLPAQTAEVEALTRHAPKEQKYPKGLGRFYGYRPQRDPNGVPKASEVLASWGVQVVPGSTVKCPAHEDRHRSLTVYKDDERVFCGSPSCKLHNGGHGVGSIVLAKMEAL